MVCLHLEGRRLNGKLVESSWTSVAPPCLEAGRTPEFPALGEAVLGMRAGGRREIIVPPSRSAFQPDFRSFLIDLDGFRMDLRGFPHDFAGIYHDLHRFPGFFAWPRHEPLGRGGAHDLHPRGDQRVAGGEKASAAASVARSNLIGAVSRVRNALAMATHDFFQQRSFLYVPGGLGKARAEGARRLWKDFWKMKNWKKPLRND